MDIPTVVKLWIMYPPLIVTVPPVPCAIDTVEDPDTRGFKFCEISIELTLASLK